MLISHQEPKLVFIHVQKTGGVSISDLLGRFVPTITQGREVAAGTAGPKAERQIKKNNLFKYALRCGPTFDEFVRSCTGRQWMGNCYYSFAFNQLRYLTDRNGELLVDFVGRFENFAQDLSYAFDRLGLEAAQLEIPHENRSAHGHYSEMYTPETREIVRKRFRRDIEFFGYEFEKAPVREAG
jgi:hypothetical protein